MPRFGELLRRERELRKITLREVAEATKINLRYLEMLERNDFRHLPGGVFNKGFVRAYAQYIGVDSEEMINAYLLEEREQAADAGTTVPGELLRGTRAGALSREATDEPEAAPDRTNRRRILVALVALVALIVLIALLWAAIRFLAGSGTGEEPTRPPTESSSAAPVGRDPVPEGPGAGTEPPAESSTIPRDAGEDRGADAGRSGGEATGDRSAPVEGTPGPGESSPETTADTADDTTSDTTDDGLRTVVVRVIRPTDGRIVCDRRVEILDGRAAGSSWTLRCRDVLAVDAGDGGAVRIGIDGAAPRPIGPDGRPARAGNLLTAPDGSGGAGGRP